MNSTKAPEVNKYISYLFKKSVVDVIPNKNLIAEVSYEEPYKTSDDIYFYKVKILSADILQGKYRVDNNEVSDYTLWTSKRILELINSSTKQYILNSEDGIVLNGNIKIKTTDPSKINIIADESKNEIIIEPKYQRFEYTSSTEQDEYWIFHGLNTYDLNVEILIFDSDRN